MRSRLDVKDFTLLFKFNPKDLYILCVHTHTYTYMGTKTISISDEAYRIMKSRKDNGESFSEVIIKLSGKKKLSSFYGALSKESENLLERNIKEVRKKHLINHVKRIER